MSTPQPTQNSSANRAASQARPRRCAPAAGPSAFRFRTSDFRAAPQERISPLLTCPQIHQEAVKGVLVERRQGVEFEYVLQMHGEDFQPVLLHLVVNHLRVEEESHSLPNQNPFGRGSSKSSLTVHAPGWSGAVRCLTARGRGITRATGWPDLVNTTPASFAAASSTASRLGGWVESSMVFIFLIYPRARPKARGAMSPAIVESASVAAEEGQP